MITERFRSRRRKVSVEIGCPRGKLHRAGAGARPRGAAVGARSNGSVLRQKRVSGLTWTLTDLLSLAGLAVGAQVEVLAEGVEVVVGGGRAELGELQLVLDLEDGFVCPDELV